MPEEKKEGVKLEKGPGDFKDKPQIPEFRGDDGTSDAEKHRADEHEATIHYNR